MGKVLGTLAEVVHPVSEVLKLAPVGHPVSEVLNTCLHGVHFQLTSKYTIDS